jgi:hypothetical protein
MTGEQALASSIWSFGGNGHLETPSLRIGLPSPDICSHTLIMPTCDDCAYSTGLPRY